MTQNDAPQAPTASAPVPRPLGTRPAAPLRELHDPAPRDRQGAGPVRAVHSRAARRWDGRRRAGGAEIALASLDAGNPDRDAHMRSADLLDVEKCPPMAFRSTRVRGAGEKWSMEGDLAIGDVTRPVTLAVEFGGVVDSPGDGRRHAGFEATGEIRRSDYGLGFEAGLLCDVVKVQLDMQFVEPVGQEG